MIRDLRRSHYQQLTIALTISFILGWFYGEPWLFVSITAVGYLMWLLYQQHKLIAWLIGGARKTPPEAMGLWGVVFDHLYRVQRENRKQVSNYRDVVKRIRSSTEALNDGIILLDTNGNIQWWNSAAQGLLQLRREDVGQLLTNLLREPKFIRFYNKQNHRDPLTLDNPARAGRSLQIAMTLFGKGERLLLLRDVTRLQHLEQMRQDFVANASHELKTPLTVLRGHLENIITYSEDLSPGVSKALVSMNHQTLRMTNLVNDLLLLTKLDAETVSEGQDIDIPVFLQGIADDATALSAENGHNIIIQCDTHHHLQGSPGEIRSAINNLVFNAVNYSPAGTDIVILWQKTANGAVLSVIDQGAGIDHHHIPRLTERFYRVDKGRSGDQGGTGLGLAIVKHALQHHEARLDIRSEKNKGSVFSCVFPDSRIIDPQADLEDLLDDESLDEEPIQKEL